MSRLDLCFNVATGPAPPRLNEAYFIFWEMLKCPMCRPQSFCC